MYLVGAEHSSKEAARRRLERAIIDEDRLVTDADAVNRRDAIGPAFDVLLGIVDTVLPIELEDVQRARALLTAPRLQARDAIHVAVMQRHGINQVLSFDQAFDHVPGATRLS